MRIEQAVKRALLNPQSSSPLILTLMGLAKRIIPCLDVTAGRVVKGVNFVGLRDAGDPVEIARRYDEQGADELTFLDITASQRRPRPDRERHRGGGGAGLHPADRGRRRALGRRRAPPAQRRRRQGEHQYGRGAEPAAGGGCDRALRLAMHRGGGGREARARERHAALGGLHPRRTQRDRPRCAGMGPQDAGRRAPARSCSPAWTATAPATASISN